jgi:multidrug/hemolysin transport system ATP-binding protein
LLKRPYGKLSGGQKRRCDIARALLHSPKILLLDEPTTGLDPQMRSAVWETIFRIKERTDMTILLTTHYMEEAAKADEIIIMKNGRVILRNSPDKIKSTYAQDSLVLFSDKPEMLRTIFDRRGIRYRTRGEGIEIALIKTTDALTILEVCCGRYSDFEVQRGSMDDAYLKVMEQE